VTGVAVGTANITVTAAKTGYTSATATVAVTVTPVRISGVTATNGTVAVTLSNAPVANPTATDFTFTQKIGTADATALTVANFAWNATTKVGTFTFTAVAATAADQSVVVSASYKGGTAVKAAAFTVSAQLSIEQLVAQLMPKVFRVDVFDDTGTKICSGSAVAVGALEVITNYHVVKDAASAKLVDDSGRTLEVLGMTAYNQSQDLAVLRVAQTLQPVTLRTTPARVGEEVVAIGSPLGLTNIVSTGIVSGLRIQDGIDVIQTTAPISPGSSGGGLFDRQGNLLGITTSYYVAGQNLNLAIPMVYVNPLVVAGRTGSVQKLPGYNVLTESNLVETVRRRFPSFQAGIRMVYPSFSLVPWSVVSGNYAPTFFSVDLDNSQYLAFLQGMVAGDFQANCRTVEAYLCGIGQLMQQVYPSKDINVDLFHVGYYSTYPTFFKSSEVFLTSDGQWWIVVHLVGVIRCVGGLWYSSWY
jgi:S1-C subfamily serine protease